MIDKDSMNSDNSRYVAEVNIIDVEKRYRPGPKHYVYVIQVTWANPANTYIIYRRYAQFFDLQCKLLDLFAEAPSPSNNYNTHHRIIPFLPGKIFLGRSQIRRVALERKHALNIYCKSLISLHPRISRSRFVLQFFQSLPTDVQNSSKLASRENRAATTKSALIISSPSKLATFRCIDNFEAVEETELPLKRNTLVQVIHKHLNGWWFVQNNDRTGFVPGAFLEPVEQERETLDANTLPKSVNDTYVVNKSYQAKTPEEISLDQGTFVTVLEKSFTGWWIVKFNDYTGQFPAIYLTSCKGRATPTNMLQQKSPNTRVQPDVNSQFKSEESTKSLFNPPVERHSTLASYEQNEHEEFPKQGEPEIFYVHTNFFDEVGDCISLQRGDRVEIHEKHHSGWWLGRRLQDDFILNWLPASFLQNEPIFEENFHSNSYLSLIPETCSPKTHQEQQHITQNIAPIYQNVAEQVLTNSDTVEVFNNTPIINSPLSFTSATNHNNDSSEKTSVRDLVKLFNRQKQT